MVENEPLRPPDTKKLIRKIMKDGSVSYAEPHALERLAKHKMSMLDCTNILRAGMAREGEWENGEWRYQIYTGKMTVVIRFEDETELMIVTAWRER
jgi:hypothetical protein